MIVIGKHRRAQKNLSAYADGELSAKETQALEAHFETCEQCRIDLDGLRATMGALRGLPDVEPRRSFALTPEMVTPARPAPSPGPAPALTYGTRLAAAGLAAALVIVFAIDLSASDNPGSDAGQTVPLSAERELSSFEDSAEGPAARTTGPEPASTLSPLSQPLPGGAAGGEGGASDETPAADSGDVAADAGGAEEMFTADGEALPADESTAGADDSGTNGLSIDAEIDDGTDDQGSPEELTPLNADDRGFDTLLAIEITLAAGFAAALAGAIWLTIAARQREIRP